MKVSTSNSINRHVYNPTQYVPGIVDANSRALYCAKGGAFSATQMLDQSPLNQGTRRTGREGACYTADGVDDEVNYGDIGAAIWFSGWVKLNSDNQCLFSLSNDTNTNVIVSAGVLAAGATLTLTGIKVDDVSKTASEAGVLLNDNAWHFLSCGIGDGLGGASTADDVRFFTNGTNHGSISGFDWRFWATTPTAAELTEAYSGDTNNRNIAALSKYSLWDFCQTEDGVLSYGSSGNGNNGTITNATLANFHDTQDIYSFANQVGFNLSGSTVIPRDESDPANDVLGNPLTYTGRRPNDAALKGSNCLTINGTNQAARVADNADLDITDNLTVCCWVKSDVGTLAGNVTFVSKYDFGLSQREWYFGFRATGEPILVIGGAGGGTPSTVYAASPIVVDTWQFLAATFDGGVTKIYINGAEVSTLDAGTPLTTLNNFAVPLTVGCNLDSGTGANFLDGQICDVRIYAGDSTVLTDAQIQSIYEDGSENIEFEGQDLRAHYKQAEGSGTTSYDSSGNANHGAIENAASNWSNTQDVYHSNLLNGFSLYEHASSDPIRVPFDVSGNPISITPPTGYTLTRHYPAGSSYKKAETTIDLDPDSTPEMGASQLGTTVPSAHAFGDAWAASTQIFSRQRLTTEDRFVIMTAVQSGSALATIQKYTQA